MKYSKAIVLQQKVENLVSDLNAAMFEACQYGLLVDAELKPTPVMVGQRGAIELRVWVTVRPDQLEIDA